MAVMYDCKADPRQASVWGTPQFHAEEVMVVEYDFTKMGGALGDYILGTLPKNCSVSQVAYIWTVAPTSAGTDVDTLGLASTGDVKLIADMGSASTVSTWYCGTPAINNTTASTWVKVTADTDIYFTIATAALTAGHFFGLIRYFNVPSA